MTVFAILALMLTAPPTLEVSFSPLLSDHCVLQRDVPVRLWGTAQPDAAFELVLAGPDGAIERFPTRAGKSGEWQVTLPPHEAGGPYMISASPPSDPLAPAGQSDSTASASSSGPSLSDVLFGEVWICSGQSNMEFALRDEAEGPAVRAAPRDSLLRLFITPHRIADQPEEDLAEGRWILDPEEFSAVGYYFARSLRIALGVPVGMIQAAWGGTRIEAWTSPDANRRLGIDPTELLPLPQRIEADPFLKARHDLWISLGSPQPPFEDPGRAALTAGWEFEAHGAGWRTARQPGDWGRLGIPELAGIDGGVWFRKVVHVPAGLAGRELTAHLGPIDDYDTTFFNGTQVGAVGRETPDFWRTPRRYPVPGVLVKAGDNLISIRVWNIIGGAGLEAPDDQVFLEGPDGFRAPLAGEWEYRFENVRPEPTTDDPNAASVLYNGMIHPLRRVAARGALWYQGESNADRPTEYEERLSGLIADWRDAFARPELVFLLSQLAPYANGDPANTEYAIIREAQSRVARVVPDAGVAVITDVGDELDIHPRQKRAVGERLALLAQRLAYRRPVPALAPRLAGARIEGSAIRVSFEDVGSGLEVRGGVSSGREVPSDRLVGFQVAGDDRLFFDATATLVAPNEVSVAAPSVNRPKWVRYGFRNFPVTNLWSREGLPAQPFRTDALPR